MSNQLPQYRCHKVVKALKISKILCGRQDGQGPGQTLGFSELTYTPISMSEEWMAKHKPEEGGYLVFYQDGYQSFSPAAAFESGYTRIEDTPTIVTLWSSVDHNGSSQSGVIDNEDRRGIVHRAFQLLGAIKAGQSLCENEIQFGLEVLHCMGIENRLAVRINEITGRQKR